MYGVGGGSDVGDDVRDADDGGDRRRPNADDVEMAEVSCDEDDADRTAGSPSDDDGTAAAGRDSASCKPPAPLSSRASAFSIAALMKDHDAVAPDSGVRQTDLDRRGNPLCGDHWRRPDSREYGDSGGETVNAAGSDVEYWTASFSSARQHRTLKHLNYACQ